MQDKLNCLRNMILMMLCDGQISDREKRFLCRSAKILGVELDMVKKLVKEVRASDGRLYEISSRDRAVDALKALVVMAKADRNIDDREKEYMLRFAKSIGVSNQQWKEITRQIDPGSLFDSFKAAGGKFRVRRALP